MVNGMVGWMVDGFKCVNSRCIIGICEGVIRCVIGYVSHVITGVSNILCNTHILTFDQSLCFTFATRHFCLHEQVNHSYGEIIPTGAIYHHFRQ